MNAYVRHKSWLWLKSRKWRVTVYTLPKTRLLLCLVNFMLNFMKEALNEETAETVIDLSKQLTMFLIYRFLINAWLNLFWTCAESKMLEIIIYIFRYNMHFIYHQTFPPGSSSAHLSSAFFRQQTWCLSIPLKLLSNGSQAASEHGKWSDQISVRLRCILIAPSQCRPLNIKWKLPPTPLPRFSFPSHQEAVMLWAAPQFSFSIRLSPRLFVILMLTPHSSVDESALANKFTSLIEWSSNSLLWMFLLNEFQRADWRSGKKFFLAVAPWISRLNQARVEWGAGVREERRSPGWSSYHTATPGPKTGRMAQRRLSNKQPKQKQIVHTWSPYMEPKSTHAENMT